jgi:hypothetical protein
MPPVFVKHHVPAPSSFLGWHLPAKAFRTSYSIKAVWGNGKDYFNSKMTEERIVTAWYLDMLCGLTFCFLPPLIHMLTQ